MIKRDGVVLATPKKITIAELFAGVGGFRIGLEGYDNETHPEFTRSAAGPFKTVWANQWEPPGTEARQFAYRCYGERFGFRNLENTDIHEVLDEYEAGEYDIPDFRMLVGGFPCQDYSVAKPLPKAGGIEGKKGILWWDIYRLLQLKEPEYLLLENVDRLLKSPANQRGRDFAIMLSCLYKLGYSVEWRVINAADYGLPQKRRRVYIFGEKDSPKWDLEKQLVRDGVIAKAFPIAPEISREKEFKILKSPHLVSERFGVGLKESPFQNAGVMQDGKVFTARVVAEPEEEMVPMVLADILVKDSDVPREFFIPRENLNAWKALRDPKKIERTKADGFTYTYSEGGMPWPDPIDRPARTILTGEGGSGASRMKHAVKGDSGRIRRLVPDELDQIQMFPKGWTDTGMTDGQRAFCMGNALVVEIPHRIGEQIAALDCKKQRAAQKRKSSK